MISIDLADFDTDLDHVQKLVSEVFNEEERDAFYELNLFLVDKKETVSNETLEVLVNSKTPGLNNDMAESVEDLRNILEKPNLDESELTDEERATKEAFAVLLEYILKDMNKEAAVEKQEEAISNNWNIKFKLHVDAILN